MMGFTEIKGKTDFEVFPESWFGMEILIDFYACLLEMWRTQ